MTMIINGFLLTIGGIIALVVILLLLCISVWFEEHT